MTAWWWLTDRPKQARWLSAHETQFIEDDIRRSVGNAAHRNASFVDVARDPRVYGYAFVYFAIFWCLNIFGTWTPTLLRDAGAATPIEIGAYSSLIALVSALGAYLMSRSSDHRLERFWHISGGALLTVVVFLSLRYVGGNKPATVLLLCIGSTGIFTALSLFWTTPTAYLAEHAARHGIAIMATLGSIGGFLSATLSGWLKVRTGSLSASNELAAAVLVAGIVKLCLVLRPRAQCEPLKNIPQQG